MIKKIVLTTLLALPTLSMAQTNLTPMIQMGYDWGGTTLATVYHTYEADQKIKAGNGLNLEVGAIVDAPDSPLELQLLVGYKFDYISDYNGDVTWDTIPFTAIVMLKEKRWKFGGGVTYHLNPELSGSFSGYDSTGTYFNDSVNDKYKNALGGVVEVQYMATDNLSVGLKGTFIDYKLKSDSTVTAKGNSFGINFSYAFGAKSEFR